MLVLSRRRTLLWPFNTIYYVKKISMDGITVVVSSRTLVWT